MSGARRVLLVGFDAADGEIVLDAIRERRLPVLAGLAERGVALPLRSDGEHMPESSWASLITGTPPGEHGIYNWRIVEPGGVGRTRMARGGWRRPFWSVLREYGPDPKPRVLVFDIPYAGGLEDDGVTELGGWGLRVTRQGSSWPPGLFEELTDRYPPVPQWINRDYDRNPISERRYRRILTRLTRRRTDLAIELMRRSDWDLGLVNYTEPHFAGHAFHHHLASAEPTRRRARFGCRDGLLDSYREADRCLARLLEEVGPQTDVFVISTIGLRPNECSRDLLGAILIALGYQVPAGAGAGGRRRSAALSLGTRVVPRVLRHRLRGLVSADTYEAMADRAWGEAIDWRRSRAVSEAEPGSAWIRVNLEGREPEGIVARSDRPRLIAELREELDRLTDPETGERAVAEILRIEEITSGENVGQMPDLLIRWRPGRRIRRVHHPRIGLIDGDGPYARTEHTGDGFMVAAGPGIARSPNGVEPGERSVPREIDIAPTVLHLFGCPLPEAVRGEVLECAVAAGRPRREGIDIAAKPAI